MTWLVRVLHEKTKQVFSKTVLAICWLDPGSQPSVRAGNEGVWSLDDGGIRSAEGGRPWRSGQERPVRPRGQERFDRLRVR